MPPEAEAAPAEEELPPPEPLTPEEARERRQNRWLLLLTVIAVAAVGAAAYAIVEVESTKDESREEASEAANTVRADFEVLREQVRGLEGELAQKADASTQSRIQDDLAALDRKVDRLEQESSQGGTDDLSTRVDDLEQRVDDLEQESN